MSIAEIPAAFHDKQPPSERRCLMMAAYFLEHGGATEEDKLMFTTTLIDSTTKTDENVTTHICPYLTPGCIVTGIKTRLHAVECPPAIPHNIN